MAEGGALRPHGEQPAAVKIGPIFLPQPGLFRVQWQAFFLWCTDRIHRLISVHHQNLNPHHTPYS